MSWLIDIMLAGLNFFYSYTGNYGFSIIFLTILINMALYPLTLSSIVQMSALQKIQPKIQEIQKKFKEKPAELQKALSEIYKNEKVNPFGGCLPMLLKIPFFIGFFMALQSTQFKSIIADPSVNSSFLWIANLAKPDPTYTMIILIAISTYLSQKSMPNAASNQQMAGFNMFMPIFIAFVSISFPAGVQLYWIASSLVGAAQQFFIMKYVVLKKESF
ncbi:hypothetical protein A2230_02515 [candidate division WOR-1 bacterium RIFOXYA2_FULL_36_21]|uniref:Membrane insertase YidC/Oxa/ALB C-terminal domain-containing protein n=1 Tax=candidate division WOR-1 bacterium RIFOXYB2_FULL_36_35 TaxID=1802578 RepID=A0A1F4S700_UNCSA|nr:MAG: hypothetical protein A2230_02515 [candidate division WOR-1 bacterium RIFOXYA2_FULL_36_21]OGC16181.1 MAG: hypothetical protein A2290_02875 [candidate division WOR-1 bacterium RIFOXYB2_FULL_36_35]OGC16904.1 MAG: hypothetical protein A2282_00625 [candidate division WOR-1 bacterium RIFOXYA12_FULL_36_13]